ncbi:C-type lectin domain family 4 member M-like [Saccostrea echinata]|uniref:C-type lectin domain family 4 member M-like n=1 Tax=Saccostrea echinata TaxID=191078 RepID=UPI002A7EE3CE|nr:C-type lectin domain family 4 member M-like [Saccostrea echinata]
MLWLFFGVLLTLIFTKAQPLYSNSMDIYHRGSSADVNEIVHNLFSKGFVELTKTMNSEIYDLKSCWNKDFKKVKSTVDAFDEHQKMLAEAVSEIKTNITITSKATQSLLYFDKMAFKRQLENLSSSYGEEKERTDKAIEQLSLLEERMVNQSDLISNVMRDLLDQVRNQEDLFDNVTTIFVKIKEMGTIHSNMETQFTRTLNRSINELKDMSEEMIKNKTKQIFRRISDLTFNLTSALANTSEEMETTKTLVQTTEEQDKKLLELVEGMQNELAKLKNSISNLTKDIPSKSCPSDWSSFGSSCYMIIKQKKSWDDAAVKCLRYGAKLVEIETKEENDFLKQTLINTNDIYWTGGIDEVTEGRFVWASTGNPLTFKDWNDGEPNDYNKREDCLDFSKGFNRRKLWNDNRCESKFYFVCEKTVLFI